MHMSSTGAGAKTGSQANIADVTRVLMKAAHLQQPDLAEGLGWKVATLQAKLGGARKFSVDDVVTLARFFQKFFPDVTVESFLAPAHTLFAKGAYLSSHSAAA